MSTKPQKAPLFNSDKELAEFMLSNVSESLKQAIKAVVKIMVKQEMNQFRKEAEEKLSFNGYYHRQLLCGLGKIEDVPIARFREKQMADIPLDSLSVFDREKEKFLSLIAEMHRHGVSDRKVGQICQSVYGMKFSKNRVSIVHRKLAEEESLNINSQPITDEFEYLLLDGIWVKAKSFGLKDNNKTVLLCGLGITKAGERKIIGFTPADGESHETWLISFLASRKEG
jgi:transposase-like protein